jgi:uncharacterized protein
MAPETLQVILVPTLKCNADCDYCFETKSSATMSLDNLTLLIRKLVDYMEETGMDETTIYWQGGEVLTMPPEWYIRAAEIIEDLTRAKEKKIINIMQSNLLGYSSEWNTIIRAMFSNRIGSSLDSPNLYRRVLGQDPDTYNALWLDRFREASANQIEIGVITIPNEASFEVGAEAFYSYFCDEIELRSFQLNTPFPGGRSNSTKRRFPLDTERLSHFYLDLVDVWLERGYAQGIRISPFDVLLKYFLDDVLEGLHCPWQPNCARLFFCVDPTGNVSQCDCWVTSYPEFRFGNIFTDDINEILDSKMRRLISERPIHLIENCDCVECEYLAICHGGCAVRAYSSFGDIRFKDPYCYTYKTVYKHLEKKAAQLAAKRVSIVSQFKGQPNVEPIAQIEDDSRSESYSKNIGL